MTKKIEEKIIEQINAWGICGDTIIDDTFIDIDFIDHALIDSMGAALLAEMVEENFNIEIPMQSLIAELRSINSIALYIKEQQLEVI